MPLKNSRKQHAVGQGFFHSGSLDEEGRLRLRYVYDCGAMHRYATARDASIDAYIEEVGVGEQIDLLYLSHVHADHVNGVSRLLDAKRGLRVDTIVLPLINIKDKLTALARTAAEDPGAAAEPFYQQFILNPVDALARFNPRQILFVEPGRGDGGAPGRDGQPIDGPFPSDPSGETPIRGEGWKLVGRGAVRAADEIEVGAGDPSRTFPVLVIPDSLAMAVASSGALTTFEWLLAPYVDPTIETFTDDFLDDLSDRLDMDRVTLEIWLEDMGNVQALVTTELSELAAAYSSITDDLNITSLCLYSGPASSAFSLPRHAQAMMGRVVHRSRRGRPNRIAWLATGDAALKQKARRDDFIDHYRLYLKQVLTLTLPHHGSDHNFHIELLDHIDPHHYLAAADRFKNWNHPGSRAIQAVASRGGFLHVVTASQRSTACERAWIG